MAVVRGIMAGGLAVGAAAVPLSSVSSSFNASSLQSCVSLPVLKSRRSLALRASAEESANFGTQAKKSSTPKIATNAVATKQEVPAGTATKGPGHELLLFEALREGLEEEMERDPRVCVMGEDVGHYGGSYKVTKGFAEKFGDWRLLDTPIAENSFTGMAIGAAMTGLRPVIEGMNMGFLLLAYNQISNN